MMGQRKTCRTHTRNEHFVSGWRTWQRSLEIQRIPSCQERVDLEPPGQFEHIAQGPRFGARDIHRCLLLKDTRL